jgi:hypothetical protein
MPDAGVVASTNWIGEATLQRIPRGMQRIEVRKLGYAPAEIQIVVRTDTVGPVFRLEAAPSLDTVRITAQNHPRRMDEFFSRLRMGIGRFLTDSVLAKEKNRDLALVLSMRFPGVRAQWCDSCHSYTLVSTRGSGGLLSSACGVDVYLDGLRLGGDAMAMDPGDLAGAELYSMASAPARYRPFTGSCHVLLLWTKF